MPRTDDAGPTSSNACCWTWASDRDPPGWEFATRPPVGAAGTSTAQHHTGDDEDDRGVRRAQWPANAVGVFQTARFGGGRHFELAPGVRVGDMSNAAINRAYDAWRASPQLRAAAAAAGGGGGPNRNKWRRRTVRVVFPPSAAGAANANHRSALSSVLQAIRRTPSALGISADPSVEPASGTDGEGAGSRHGCSVLTVSGLWRDSRVPDGNAGGGGGGGGDDDVAVSARAALRAWASVEAALLEAAMTFPALEAVLYPSTDLLYQLLPSMATDYARAYLATTWVIVQRFGGKVYGGCVRDVLLNPAVLDWDPRGRQVDIDVEARADASVEGGHALLLALNACVPRNVHLKFVLCEEKPGVAAHIEARWSPPPPYPSATDGDNAPSEVAVPVEFVDAEAHKRRMDMSFNNLALDRADGLQQKFAGQGGSLVVAVRDAVQRQGHAVNAENTPYQVRRRLWRMKRGFALTNVDAATGHVSQAVAPDAEEERAPLTLRLPSPILPSLPRRLRFRDVPQLRAQHEGLAQLHAQWASIDHECVASGIATPSEAKRLSACPMRAWLDDSVADIGCMLRTRFDGLAGCGSDQLGPQQAHGVRLACSDIGDALDAAPCSSSTSSSAPGSPSPAMMGRKPAMVAETYGDLLMMLVSLVAAMTTAVDGIVADVPGTAAAASGDVAGSTVAPARAGAPRGRGAAAGDDGDDEELGTGGYAY